MEFLIVTGLSGAGKSRATVQLEDLGYYCVDNIPVDMIPVLADICAAGGPRYEKTAVVADIRTLSDQKGGQITAHSLIDAFDELSRRGVNYQIMFLEARDEVILRRYKETRRRHPLADGQETILNAIHREREILAPVRDRASFTVDTSDTSAAGLREYLLTLFDRDPANEMQVRVISFGYKYGIPPESDFVFDARFLPNPFYVHELRQVSGKDPAVVNYLNSFDATKKFCDKLFEMADFLLPQFDADERATLVFSVGCTGGQHRSVALAEMLGEHIRGQGRRVTVYHRDAQKNISEIKERDK